MAGSKTIGWSQEMLGMLNAPSGAFLALFTSDTTTAEASVVTEVTGAGYARLAPTFDITPTVDGAKAVLNAELNFGPCSEPTGWGEIKSYGIYDSLTGGRLMYFGDLTNPRTILDTDIVRFAVGSIEIDES
jgi:hypothetical protein